MENTSGTGRAAAVPAEIDHWNWGAFLLNWIWGVGNNTFIALLALIPFVGLVMMFVLGAKGSAWAWQNQRWESVERFKSTQRKWAFWAFVVWGIYIFVYTILFIIIVSSPLDSKPKNVEAELVKGLIKGFTDAANEENPTLPRMLDQSTRLDKMTVGPGPRIVYHHTLPEYVSGDLDENLFQMTQRSEVARILCADTDDVKKSLQYGGIFVYVYSGSDGVEIARFEIDRNDCGFPKATP